MCTLRLDWTTQAEHTSPLRAGCEARRREVVLIFVVVNLAPSRLVERETTQPITLDWTGLDWTT